MLPIRRQCFVGVIKDPGRILKISALLLFLKQNNIKIPLKAGEFFLLFFSKTKFVKKRPWTKS